jgi:hypothetical protein
MAPVAKRQTRRTQNPVTGDSGVGSIPTRGTRNYAAMGRIQAATRNRVLPVAYPLQSVTPNRLRRRVVDLLQKEADELVASTGCSKTEACRYLAGTLGCSEASVKRWVWDYPSDPRCKAVHVPEPTLLYRIALYCGVDVAELLRP